MTTRGCRDEIILEDPSRNHELLQSNWKKKRKEGKADISVENTSEHW